MNNGVFWIRYYKCPPININDNQELVNHGLEQVFISISHDVNLAILRNTMAVISEAGSSYLFGAPDFNLMCLVSSHCSIAKKIVFSVEFCRQLFVLLSCFYWPLHCLSSICMRFLTPPHLVSSF
jgi:hypothetical protein